jgi:hypothetical protein
MLVGRLSEDRCARPTKNPLNPVSFPDYGPEQSLRQKASTLSSLPLLKTEGNMRKLLIAFIAALLVGCGTSNQALKAQHPYLAISQSDADDTVTLATITSNAVAETDFNLRFTLRITAPAGDYVLKGKDYSGGRYFGARSFKRVSLDYVGPSFKRESEPDFFDGGVFVDAQGLTYLYWFWDDKTQPVRVPAPNLKVAVSTEIDQARVRDRQQREERERLATAQKLRDQRAKQEQKEALAAALSRDRVSCAGEQCDRAFAQGQAYLLKQADMRIQVATSTLIETYNANEDGRLSMRLLKVPTAGGRWEIVMSANCRDEKGIFEDVCALKLLNVYSGFLPHMQRY